MAAPSLPGTARNGTVDVALGAVVGEDSPSLLAEAHATATRAKMMSANPSPGSEALRLTATTLSALVFSSVSSAMATNLDDTP
jgi:hypothetical protein